MNKRSWQRRSAVSLVAFLACGLADSVGAAPTVDCQKTPWMEECAEDKNDYDKTITDADPRFVANIRKVDVTANVEVIGGSAANGRFPEVVTLTGGSSICTGAVIAPRLVVTAKHCLQDGVGVAGTDVKFGDDYRAPSMVIKVAEALAMPNRAAAPSSADGRGLRATSTATPWGTDIALVRLAADAPAKPVPIASDARVMANAAVRVVGFGRTEQKTFGKKLTARLIIATHDCAGNLKPKAGPTELTDKTFYGCEKIELVAAGRRDKDTKLSADTCNGDSGGPAYVAPFDLTHPAEKFERAFDRSNPVKEAPRFALAAVTSRGIKSQYIGGTLACGQGGIYTRITGDVLAWIQNTAKDWRITLQTVK